MRFAALAGVTAFLIARPVGSAEPAVTLAIDIAHPGHAASPVLPGVFFEDTNYSAPPRA